MVASRSKSSSGRKESVKKRNNYVSKITAKVIEKISAEKLKTAKNPKATQKWLDKMKLSLLRKISAASKILFAGQDQSIEALSSDVEATRQTLVTKAKKVQAMIESRRQSSRLMDIPKLTPAAEHQAHEPGQFVQKTAEIGELFTEVAQQLSFVNKDLENRVSAINNSYAAAKPVIINAINAIEVTKKSTSTQDPGSEASASASSSSNGNGNGNGNGSSSKEQVTVVNLNSSGKKNAVVKGGSGGSSSKKATRSVSIGATSKTPALKLFNHLNKN